MDKQLKRKQRFLRDGKTRLVNHHRRWFVEHGDLIGTAYLGVNF